MTFFVFDMIRIIMIGLFLVLISISFSCEEVSIPDPDKDNTFIQLLSLSIGTQGLDPNTPTENISLDQPIVARFSKSLDTSSIRTHFVLLDEIQSELSLSYFFLDNEKTISAKPPEGLAQNTSYRILLKEGIKSKEGVEFPGAEFEIKTLQEPLRLTKFLLDGQNLDTAIKILDIEPTFTLEVEFSHEVGLDDLEQALSIQSPKHFLALKVDQIVGSNSRFSIQPINPAEHLSLHTINLSSQLQARDGKAFEGISKRFYTRLDTTPKFPLLGDDELLSLIQQQHFKYFWDFGHPISGLARERNTSGDLVTSGGSGFGLMAIIVAIERGFISRAEGVERLKIIVDFLQKADRFHGAWSHWLHGATGKVIPFSSNDNGGDLVETSYLIMGLLTARQYLNDQNSEETAIKSQIDTLWRQVEWDWYTQGGQKVLYWHWSPQFNWEKNLKISGYNEALITYILAASSPTHAVDSSVYHQGWARNGAIQNGNSHYGISLPLGRQLGGPLFFEHYTFMGINPKNLSDRYADYSLQTRNHSQINYLYCVNNPKNYVGYSECCWGLTASDGNSSYSAHSPSNDRGVISPTAALSSMPYTPLASTKALKHFYYVLGDKLWGQYGFYDAFNITEGWVANSFLAIDQGPIIVMIENHRTSLIWDLFMSCPEIQTGLTNLGFRF